MDQNISTEPLTHSEVFRQLRKELYGEEQSSDSNTHIFIILGASVSTTSKLLTICPELPLFPLFKNSIRYICKLSNLQKWLLCFRYLKVPGKKSASWLARQGRHIHLIFCLHETTNWKKEICDRAQLSWQNCSGRRTIHWGMLQWGNQNLKARGWAHVDWNAAASTTNVAVFVCCPCLLSFFQSQ